MMALASTTLTGGFSASSALARDNDGRGWHQDRHGHGDHGRREWRGDRDHYYYQPEYRRPYYYSQPVYVPPPVYYEPRQSPGVSLFFPLDLRSGAKLITPYRGPAVGGWPFSFD